MLMFSHTAMDEVVVMDPKDQISLKDAIANLRRELLEAARAADGEEFTFKIDDIELELQVGVDRSASGGGEVNWWILKGSGEYDYSTTRSHTVKIKLNAGEIEVGDNRRTK